jgi:hypothetical protein
MHCSYKSCNSHLTSLLLVLMAGTLSAQVLSPVPTKIVKALDAQYPGWKLTSIPDDRSKACYVNAMQADSLLDRKARTAAQLFFISGDFDEDGRLDYSVSIVFRRRNLVIAFLDRRPVPKSIILEQGEAPTAYIELRRKGAPRYRDEHGVEHPFVRDAIELFRCGWGASDGDPYRDIFIYVNGSFRKEDWVPPMPPSTPLAK